jgi:hypothetical protein
MEARRDPKPAFLPLLVASLLFFSPASYSRADLAAPVIPKADPKIKEPVTPLPIKKEKKKFTEDEQKARLIGFNPVRTKALDPSLPEKEFLMQIAQDTWGYFRDIVDKDTGMPLDNIVVASTFSKVNSYTSTTNMGLYMMSVVAGYDLSFISRAEAVSRIQRLMASLRALKTWQGQFFNYYETITLENSGQFVSSVDNGWLAAGLIVARQAFPEELAAEADALLEQLNFGKLYDPAHGQLYLGFDAEKNAYSPYHYGMFSTEPRLASYIGIAKGDLPEEHWFRIFRTLPQKWDWQRQKPAGKEKKVLGHRFFSGYYVHEDLKFVPSWGGSLFEFLMPTLVLDEQRLAPRGLGLNNERAVEAHIQFAEGKEYSVWGMSPCSIPEEPEGYKEYGVEFLGSKGYADGGVITPHVTFLALAVKPKEAIENLRNLAKFKEIYGGYGFYDSVNAVTGQTSPRYLSLDQSMSFIALSNYLNGGIRKRFHSHPAIAAQEKLLKSEKFF